MQKKNFTKPTTRRHQKPILLGLCNCVIAIKALFSLPYHSSLFPYAIFPIITTLTLPNSYPLSHPLIKPYLVKTPNPNLSKYPKPLHIPKQNSPYNPYSHHITPLLILFLFQCPPSWQISKQYLSSPSSKG